MNCLCVECHHFGKPKNGGFPTLLLIMIPLLLLFDSGRETLFCPKCKSENSMVPVNSDIAKEVIKKQKLTIPDSMLSEPKYPWQD